MEMIFILFSFYSIHLSTWQPHQSFLIPLLKISWVNAPVYQTLSHEVGVGLLKLWIVIPTIAAILEFPLCCRNEMTNFWTYVFRNLPWLPLSNISISLQKLDLSLCWRLVNERQITWKEGGVKMFLVGFNRIRQVPSELWAHLILW